MVFRPRINNVINILENQGIELNKLSTLEMFGRDGTAHVTAYAEKVRSLEVWEIDKKWEADLKNNLPNAKIKIIDSKDYNLLEDFVYDWAPSDKSKIAIIYAVGGIISGESNPGPSGSSLMGDKTISKAIKRAREDNDIKAIVFRIDSGGGSALASDMI